MSGKRRVDLVAYFLRGSPASQYRSLTKIIPINEYSRFQAPPVPTDEDYLCDFFDRLEVVGPSNANFATYKNRKNAITPSLRRIFPSMLIMKKPHEQPQESEQLAEAIKLVSTHAGEGTILFQELEQRLKIASPLLIGEARTRFIYLFKLLINRRDKILPGSLVLDANLQLSRAIIDALARAQKDEPTENWKQLEAMEKLLRAREYHKKGLREIALSNFEEIFRDEAASAKTRM